MSVDDREYYTKILRCAGCGAIARLKFSVGPPHQAAANTPRRAIEAVASAFTARITGEQAFMVHCQTCVTTTDHAY